MTEVLLTNGKQVTINDVARRAQVSNATVSRYINKSPAVAESKAAAIEEAIAALGFHLNRTARVLKMQRSMQIMMVVPDIANPFYSAAYKVLQSLAMQSGYTVVLYNTNDSESEEYAAIEMAHGMNTDGLVFCSTYDHPHIFDALESLERPVVASNSFGRLQFDTIHSIKGQGLYVTTRYLLELGHRAVAYAGGNEKSTLNARRLEGYLRAMDEFGLTPPPTHRFHAEFNMEGGYRAAQHFLSLEKRPTAIACANDLIALGLIQTLIGSGVRVPDDISVTGMDNIEFARLSMPPITTVTNDSREFAENCLKLLFSRIDGGYTGPPREYLTSRKLIVRSSSLKCGVPVE
ncbi:MAG: LacI family transcriptional regulator [Clostridiales bacterium]|jgi:LacI family transcriptional regulator|nr:LacI family transcriptional regulator [Clostridiales bacterium]